MEMAAAGCACLRVGETPHTPIMSGPQKKKLKKKKRSISAALLHHLVVPGMLLLHFSCYG